MRRKRVSRSAGEWKRIVAGFVPGEYSQRAYCAERGVTLSSFIRWRKLLGAMVPREKKAPSPFVAVGSLPASGLLGPAAVLRFPDGAKIELSRIPDPDWIREVLRSP